MTLEPNPKLEAAILADPDDTAAYLVYADWLQSRGDPRGELIVLHHQLGKLDKTTELEAWSAIDLAVRSHLATHAELLLGPLGTFLASKGRRKLELVWHLGFVRSLTIGWGMYGGGGTPELATAELAAILSHPSSRFITTLALGPAPAEETLSPQCLIDAMVATGQPAGLRSLFCGYTSDWDISMTSTGDFGAIAAQFKELRTVRLRGGEVTIGEIDLPELRSFAVETGQLTAGDIAAICAARWPKLESLSIWFGNPRYGASGGVEDLLPIFEAQGLPNLRHLGLQNCPWADEIARAIPGTAILRQLATLDLSMGALTDAGVAAMAAHADAFAHLTYLNVSDNALTDASRADLAKFTAQVESHGHDTDRADGELDERYCAVGE